MKTRLELHEELCDLLGSRHVYFQPPESLKLEYPCFVYSRNADFVHRANNQPYLYEHNYQLMYITDDPETEMPIRVLRRFQKCRSGGPFVSDNLNHFPFDIYY
jgi:hypothetical protein